MLAEKITAHSLKVVAGLRLSHTIRSTSELLTWVISNSYQ